MWALMLKLVVLLLSGYVTQANLLNPVHPIPWSLLESTEGVARLAIDCTGTLTIESTSPSHCSGCFGVVGSDIFYAARNGDSLDYDKYNQYTFSMICNEAGVLTSGDVTLNVIPNFSPRFQDTTSVIEVMPGIPTGGSVYDPRPSDPENDALSFTLTETPNNGFFKMSPNGVVLAKKDLNTFCNEETVTISMNDGFNPPVNKTIKMDPGTNTKPVLKDWNRSIYIPENTVLNLPITDNLGSTGSCDITVVPGEYASFFDSSSRCPQGSTSRIITPSGGKTFNFEQDPPVNISLIFDNGNCPSDEIWLYITWTDEQEPPKLTLNKMDYIEREGSVVVKPDYQIEDEDQQQEKHVYSFVHPDLVNPNFKIDPDTGQIYTQEYYMIDCIEDRNGFKFDVLALSKYHLMKL